MKIDHIHAYLARSALCSLQAGLTKDADLRKLWDDLAIDWIALDSTMSAITHARMSLSFVGKK